MPAARLEPRPQSVGTAGNGQAGAQTGPFAIRWTNSYWPEEIASGLISADMQGEIEGPFRIQIDELDQTIILLASRRRYGGRQWCVPRHEPSCVGALDAHWSAPVCEPASVGAAGRV